MDASFFRCRASCSHKKLKVGSLLYEQAQSQGYDFCQECKVNIYIGYTGCLEIFLLEEFQVITVRVPQTFQNLLPM